MPRVNMKKYTPLQDSAGGGVLSVAQVAKHSRELNAVVLGVPDGACPCGCGEELAKGSRFRMGHDARYKGKLMRAALADVKVAIFDGAGSHRLHDPMTLVRTEGWVDFVQAALDRREAANMAVLQDAVGAERLVRVGRWEYTGQVAAVYKTKSGEEFDVDYVTKQGQRRRVRVPASQTREVAA